MLINNHSEDAMNANHLKSTLLRLACDEEGATAVEYGLLAALLGAGIVVAVTGLREQLRNMFGFVSTTVQNSR